MARGADERSVSAAILLCAALSVGLTEAAEGEMRELRADPATHPEITEADLAQHVTALASEAFEGRLAGTPGEAAAAAYISDAFRRIGLAPAGDPGGYRQTFTFPAGVSFGPRNRLAVALGRAANRPALDRDWRPLTFSDTGEAAGDVVFAGYGLVAPAAQGQAGIDSYADLDVRGKWVLLLRGLPSDAAPERQAFLRRFAGLRFRATVAKARGALGVIYAPPPKISPASALPRLRYRASRGRPGLPVIGVGRQLAARLLADVPEGLIARIERGEPAPAELWGVRVRAHIDMSREQKVAHNVIGRLDLDGLPPEKGAAPVILGAHFDHLGRGETSGSLAKVDERGQIHPGADDNASGTAAVIEIAEFFAAERSAGRLSAARDVIFAAWSAEELGLLGSQHYVAKLQREVELARLTSVISAYVNLDMVGRLRGTLTVQGLGSSPIWKGEIAWQAASLGLSLSPSDETYLGTDATSFYRAGVPILALFTGIHDAYHSPRDRAEQVNIPGLARVARFAAGIVSERARDRMHPPFADRPRPAGHRGPNRALASIGATFRLGAGSAPGLVVDQVLEGGPAEAAGLLSGDRITELAGARIGGRYDYLAVMNGVRLGGLVPISVERAGRRLSIDISPEPAE